MTENEIETPTRPQLFQTYERTPHHPWEVLPTLIWDLEANRWCLSIAPPSDYDYCIRIIINYHLGYSKDEPIDYTIKAHNYSYSDEILTVESRTERKLRHQQIVEHEGSVPENANDHHLTIKDNDPFWNRVRDALSRFQAIMLLVNPNICH